MNSEIPPRTRNAPTAIAIALDPLRLPPLEVVVVSWRAGVCVLETVGGVVCWNGANGFDGPAARAAGGPSE